MPAGAYEALLREIKEETGLGAHSLRRRRIRWQDFRHTYPDGQRIEAFSPEDNLPALTWPYPKELFRDRPQCVYA